MMLIVPGTTIGRYVVDRTIGTGGMALALRCRFATVGGFQKYVLLKILHPERMEDPQYIEMFLDEARVTAGLTHPNIPQTFELEQHEGLPYLVMEFVDGPSLHAIHRKIEHDPHKHYGLVAWIMAGVCRALAYAHSRTDVDGQALHIIHRDVSLANILVNSEGIPKLVDFGIAKSRIAKSVTEVGTLKGKLLYLAPEQIVGEQFDHRVDIYQTGVCLYWLTTGHAPLTTEDPVKFFRERLDNDPPLPSELNPDYPAALERIVLKALVRDRERRWTDAATMADALEDFAKSEGVDARVAAKKLKALFQTASGMTSFESHDAGSGAYPRIGDSLSSVPKPKPIRSDPPRRPAVGRTLAVGALIVVLGVVAVAGWVKDAPQVSQTPPTAGATSDDQVRSMLAEAQKKIGEGNLTVASMLMEQLKAQRVTDGALLVQIAELQLKLQRASRIAEVKRLLASGQAAAALDQCRLLLDEYVDDTEIQALLAECKRAADGNIQSSNARGSLTVSSSPAGATVYVDDVPVGRTPVSGLLIPVGKHGLHVRMKGYAAQQRRIEIKTNRQESISFSLQPLQDRGAPTTQAGVPTQALPAPEDAPGAPEIVPASDPAALSAASATATSAPEVLEASVVPGAVSGTAVPGADAGARVAPSASRARSAAEVRQVLQSVEAQALRSGVPAEIASGVTGALQSQLLALSPAPAVYLLYPSEMLQVIQNGVSNGLGRDAIAAELRRRYGRPGASQ